MIIFINDEALSIDTPCMLDELLRTKEFFAEHMAVAVNNQFVPKSLRATTQLQNNDRIDLIVPMQGG